MKNALLKRVEEVAQKAADLPVRNIQKLVSKMTTAELKECLDDRTTDNRFEEIVKGAACR